MFIQQAGADNKQVAQRRTVVRALEEDKAANVVLRYT